MRTVSLERSEPHYAIDLRMVRLDPRRVAPRIVRSAEFDLPGADVKTLAEKSGAIAAINASYFDERGRPLGFLKANAQEITPRISKSSLYTGVFGVKDRLPFIVHRDDFAPEQADEGLQAGPLLLVQGKSLSVTRGAGKQSRRALIGLDRVQRLIIAVTDSLVGGMNWVELQEFFGAARWRVGAAELLNLDGGRSAQLFVRGEKFEAHVPGGSDIPVAIGFFQKEN